MQNGWILELILWKKIGESTVCVHVPILQLAREKTAIFVFPNMAIIF